MLTNTVPSTLPDFSDLWQETLGWQPSVAQNSLFQQLYEGILEGNQQLNLTRITDPIEFWEKHLWDSLSGIKSFLQLPSNELSNPDTSHLTPERNLNPYRVIDIGTGAGFPGLPIAIAQPSWQVTLLDSTRKKLDFVSQLLERLNIANATTLVDRVEQIGRDRAHREQYDLVVVRAVGAASICVEYALPLVKIGGLAVLYRGQWLEEEAEDLAPVVNLLLGGELEQVTAFKTPITHGDRHCLYIRKVAPTQPLYPRAVGIPAQKPLVLTSAASLPHRSNPADDTAL
ncbi:16S rRNA (guanine(527)-N(7))-methyltransferase RsmG [Phormidium sp. CLA17]|uniref:16S rRNA (guanine(527)-N(7))-methyltransferase RsmG n=1 Tax=Leptolyngbya sp. Cla-17 TaxID=2803751 RepID=UPI0014918213|nr:16S rRNA (guanine(527)-N(7))-methyltransferase RsmG [Leptolyngbya sp. Cla-17]MBM0740159.1 16S rRNA (guanine(527)-N(7))-methyltransferase RsmG [Leptolyngbya sp. Cla-17]